VDGFCFTASLARKVHLFGKLLNCTSRLVGSVNFDFVGVELTLVLLLGLGLVLPLFFAILTFNYKGFYLPTYFVESFIFVEWPILLI
jgi:hypothetical protein